MALADLHRSLADDALTELVVFGGDMDHGEFPDDDLRRPALLALAGGPPRRTSVEGAGFEIVHVETDAGKQASVEQFRATAATGTHAARLRERAACACCSCGLNPSLYSADGGVGLRPTGQPLLAGRASVPGW